MEIKNNGWSVKQLKTMKEKGNLEFDYPIQRSGGQWKLLQQSYLIHSLAQNYPVPPVYLLGEKKDVVVDKKGESVSETRTIRSILDGKQRITTMIDYMDDKYELHKDTPLVTIDGEYFLIAGMLFSELDEEVQEMISSRTILTYTLDAETTSDEEIEDLFFRMNNGSALTIQQKSKALMGVEWATRLTNAGNHKLIEELSAFSKTQMKSDGHLTAILQAMMMMDKEYNYKNVSQKVISEYATTFKEDTKRKEALLNTVIQGMDYLLNVFDKKESVLLKKVHFPMTIITAITAITENVEHEEFYGWSIAFKDAINPKAESVSYIPTSYLDYTGSGTTDRPKADGRKDEMVRHFKEFVELHPKTEN
ncbi:MAG: DUF262 domain-containing protein [Carnobacterium alterfunditum]